MKTDFKRLPGSDFLRWGGVDKCGCIDSPSTGRMTVTIEYHGRRFLRGGDSPLCLGLPRRLIEVVDGEVGQKDE